MQVSRTIVLVSIQCWLGIGFVLSCMASLTLFGHEPAPIIVKGIAQMIESRELHYGSLTVSLLNNGENGFAHFVIRKLGHFFVYSFLTIFLFQLVKASDSFFRTLLVLLMVSIFAVTDEFVQAFLPNRTPLITDIFVDLTGCLHSILLMKLWYICRLRKALA
ncbi:VanZ family protein [Bacillus sp. RAR_GA_16]|uniref:VanZ family protein n=1 Tax=Bacillus sp. RAR_GA_16 TaxID=2876774 RepID=UPI001CCE8FAB|nr:VanZ family protein [Bacillus sp. RAR_GA_16]MCA0172813.1 VanZ family protein [Bacillus sp. RAR_GA_16]